MSGRAAIALCLVFSGLTALVYEIIWTRLLAFAFGATTEAVATVLAVFFGGLALGNWWAARRLSAVRRPLRLYAWLELGIGAFALLSLPLLSRLDLLWVWLGTEHSPGTMAAIRAAAAAVVLLPPTVAMGATLPVVARGLVGDDATLGRWSALLYAANTAGAVAGAYLCGFWLIPFLGLTDAVLLCGAVNLAVALAVLAVAGRAEAPLPPPAPAPASAPDPERGRRAAFLFFFAVSGFVAIGYEVVWSKVFGIVMEGTLYGFAAVLSAYLLGIALGSLAMAPRVDAIRDLPRAFALLHVAIAAAVATGMAAVPYLPFAYRRLAVTLGSGDAVHLLFALVAPLVLLPTALFGAAFPVLIRIYTRSASGVGRGMGLAAAVNTAGSIAASLLVGFVWIPRLGMDATLYALVMIQLAVALAVLLRFQRGRPRVRRRALLASAGVFAWVALSFNGVQVEKAIAGRQIRQADLDDYRAELSEIESLPSLTIEGRSAIVTAYALPTGRLLRTNGLPEAGFDFAPPYYPTEAVLLGALPYAAAERPERALVIGLGAGNTLSTLLRTPLERIDVVELERGVVRAMDAMFAGRPDPLDDPRVTLRMNDGRNELLLARIRGGPRYDLVTSQPSHPWRVGAANLFTEEYFRLARSVLAPGGVFAIWINGFRNDVESLLAVVASFERVFPGSVLADIGRRQERRAFLLLGAREPLRLDMDALRERLAHPELAELLAAHHTGSPEALLARLEGPAAAFAAIAPGLSNTDDNAFVETRIPRRLRWTDVDFAEIERRLGPGTPVFPPRTGALDVAAVAEALLAALPPGPGWPHLAKLERILARHGDALHPAVRETLRARGRLRIPEERAAALEGLRALAERHPERPEPLRALGAHHRRRGEPGAAAEAFARAHDRSGEARDAWEAGRALHALDPEAAWRFFERIPATEREAFPALAVHAMERALRRGWRGARLAAAMERLLRYRDTPAGRTHPGADELLARAAWALGDREGARAFADASQRRREARADAAVQRARAALARGELDAAAEALRAARSASPADPRVHRLRAQLALARSDDLALAAALADLRRWAPTVEAGIAAENHLRAEHGLPLVMDRPRANAGSP